MKQLFLMAGLILILGSIPSCDKNDYNTTEDLPEWLQKKIPEIISPEMCSITYVTVIRYDEKTYYHIYCGIWSCMYCQLYDEKGNRPDWDSKTWSDFHSRKKDITTLPACKG